PYRGYMSTMETLEHFGLGKTTRVDSMEVLWPDGRSQVLTGLDVDRTVTVRQTEATTSTTSTTSTNLPFQPWHALPNKQPATPFTDYDVQPLLPYQPSRQGPPIAVADVNGDGLDDVFIGGAARIGGRLLLQRKDGSFVESVQGQPWGGAADKDYEDWGALFFDVNGDGRPDLYVASCGYKLAPVSRLLQDRLYINQGGGRFVRDTQALPPMPTCTASVAAGDFTGDGRLDLFVGGRLTPRNYPYPPRSYLLRNDGGRFTDVTATALPELSEPAGMITAAVWVDVD